jgi:hypothetical protein
MCWRWVTLELLYPFKKKGASDLLILPTRLLHHVDLRNYAQGPLVHHKRKDQPEIRLKTGIEYSEVDSNIF